MKESDFQTLVVGPNDTLFITMNGETVDRENIERFSKMLSQKRPDLDGRVFILAANEGDIKMTVVKAKREERRSMKGVC